MGRSHIEMRRWHDWTDPDFFMEGRQRERRLIPLFLRQLLPRQLQKTKLTLTGWMLIIVAMGIGSAAYNTSSNILFMTLSLLLSSLVLSGILSLFNFKRLKWELKAPEHLQVGEVGMAEVALHNEKRVFPSMSIMFRVGTSAQVAGESLYLKQAISAGESAHLEWTFVPEARGVFQVFLHGVESKFPFGFLLKSIGDTMDASIRVWPARAEYSFQPISNGRRFLSGAPKLRAGAGNDLLNLRQYERGDAPRLIHWKATARLNKLMVRQLSEEGESGFHVWLNPAAAEWIPEQFERLCSVVCALTEDLFHAGRLQSVRLADEASIPARGLREVHSFFDELALLEPPTASTSARLSVSAHSKNVITFRPSGEGGVCIYVDGSQAGEA